MRLSFQFLPLPRGLGLNVVGGWGVGKGEGGIFLRFELVYIPNHSLLLSLEFLEKFLCWWLVVVLVVVCKPILVFILSLSQAE